MYKLSVNGGLIDFIGEPKIILMANAPGDYSFGKAHKTYYIDIPPTSNNITLLGNSVKHDAILILGNIQISGILHIDTIDDDILQGMFVSGNGKVWDELRGNKLTDLDFSEYNHVLNKTNVDASETLGGFYKYDLFYRGTTIDTQEETTYSTYRNIFWENERFDITERYPAFNVKGILNKIFEGYELVDETDVFDTDMYVLFTKDYEFRNSKEWVDEYTKDITTTSSQADIDTQVGDWSEFSTDISPIVYDPGPLFPFTIPETGAYRFDFDLPVNLRVTAMSGVVETADSIEVISDAYVEINSSTRGLLLKRTYAYNVTGSSPSISIDLDIDTRYIECTAGEVITINIYFVGEYNIPIPPANPGGKAILTLSSGSNARILPLRYYGTGATVIVSDLMPDMDVLDFVKGICQWFNISIFTNPYTNQVILWPTDTISGLIDWTDKVLINKGYTITNQEKKIYRYTDLFDELKHTSITGSTFEYGDEGDYFDVKLPSNDLFVATDYLNGEKLTVLSDFKEKTYTTLADAEYLGHEYKTLAGMRFAYEDTDFDYEYVLLYCEIWGTLATGQEYYNEAKTTTPGFSWTHLYMETLRPYGLNYNVDGLFDKYHRKTIDNITNGHILNCTLVLDNIDVINMIGLTEGKDWRSVIHIMGTNYKCLELEQLEGNIYKGRFLQIF